MKKAMILLILTMSFNLLATDKRAQTLSPLKVKMPDARINDSTLLGIDSDNDGIRDDVQFWIDEKTKDKSEKLVLAYKQYAKALQLSMAASNDKDLSIKSTHNRVRSAGCFYDIAGNSGIPSRDMLKLLEEIKAMYLNTRERIEVNLQADKNFHGQLVTSEPIEKNCDFKVND